MLELDGLPGAWIVERGLADLRAGQRSEEALLLSAVSQRMARLGLSLTPISAEPEHELFDLLCSRDRSEVGDPYARYNSLRRELDSFLSSAESRVRYERSG